MASLLEIDGSVLEGGGQILRNSISLSAILGIPVRVTKIRAGRKKPGLAPQHLTGIQLVAQMCSGALTGATLGSTEIEFVPGKLKRGRYTADTQTAGAISLLIQTALPCALLADGPVTMNLMGGTNVDMAPQIDYIIEAFMFTLNKFGANFECQVLKRGYFPKGQGHVLLEVVPVRGFSNVKIIEQGTISKLYGWSFVAGRLPAKIAHEMADSAKEALQDVGEACIDCFMEGRDVAPYNGCGIMLTAEMSSASGSSCMLIGDGLGATRVEPAALGAAAAARLRSDLRCGACLDTRMQDQVILYMALASGQSEVRVGEVTLHTKTAIHVVELMTKTKFLIVPDGQTNLISCTGIGFINESFTVSE